MKHPIASAIAAALLAAFCASALASGKQASAASTPQRAAAKQGAAAVPVRDMTRPGPRPQEAPVLRALPPPCVYKGAMSDEEIARCR